MIHHHPSPLPRLQLPIQKERSKRHEGAEKNNDAPEEGELFPEKHLEETGAEGDEENAVSGPNDSHRERFPGHVLQRHGDAEENEKGYPVEHRGKPETVNGVVFEVKRHGRSVDCQGRAGTSFMPDQAFLKRQRRRILNVNNAPTRGCH